MPPPTGSPTGTLFNVAVGKPTSQASTYLNNEASFGAANAADGDRLTYTHTSCGARDWWQVDLEQEYSIEKLVLGNRLNCCGVSYLRAVKGPLHPFCSFLCCSHFAHVYHLLQPGALETVLHLLL